MTDPRRIVHGSTRPLSLLLGGTATAALLIGAAGCNGESDTQHTPSGTVTAPGPGGGGIDESTTGPGGTAAPTPPTGTPATDGDGS